MPQLCYRPLSRSSRTGNSTSRTSAGFTLACACVSSAATGAADSDRRALWSSRCSSGAEWCDVSTRCQRCHRGSGWASLHRGEQSPAGWGRFGCYLRRAGPYVIPCACNSQCRQRGRRCFLHVSGEVLRHPCRVPDLDDGRRQHAGPGEVDDGVPERLPSIRRPADGHGAQAVANIRRHLFRAIQRATSADVGNCSEPGLHVIGHQRAERLVWIAGGDVHLFTARCADLSGGILFHERRPVGPEDLNRPLCLKPSHLHSSQWHLVHTTKYASVVFALFIN
mmetsp:Transcript_111431/g.359670  ORF Transcript_111431/g.359670 Transcript_111431/m.359670 type:complete len:280 (-) Transcript_111431:191-1030(-)